MPPPPHEPPAHRSAPRARSSLGRLAILVVEGHTDLAVLLGEVLAEAGHEPVVTFTLEQARAELAVRTFDAVVADAPRVGPIDGVTLARDLSRVKRPELVVLMTDFAAPELEAVARAAGAAGVVAKPFRTQDLLDMLERTLLRALADVRT